VEATGLEPVVQGLALQQYKAVGMLRRRLQLQLQQRLQLLHTKMLEPLMSTILKLLMVE